jgi:hypothetical protein
MDVVVWLRSLGLGKYEVLFRENDIDETVLPNLTAEDLKELGIASLGHRVKLLDAIAALRNDASGKAPSVDAATPSSAPTGAAIGREFSHALLAAVAREPEAELAAALDSAKSATSMRRSRQSRSRTSNRNN